MRPIAFLLATLTLLSGTTAVDVQKSVLISYPPETPDSIVEEAKKAIVGSGGSVTHEYQLFKGFAAKVGEKILETVSTMGQEYQVLVEEDQEVHI
ncbi:Protease B inhibitor 2 [Madurella mycetomatis]|uniref:Protease B inhibitor 2 n=1 Tax=Madurella mycetomatis TaxID=100816 RepID=A0A175WCN0_9PEZI|nr:Protease B inhibitor 2 [Madurella mycetomatis]